MDSIERTNFPTILSEGENLSPDIFPRFKKVRDALIQCIYEPPNPDITRNFKTHYWPDGVNEHRGTISGEKDGITLSFKINGDSVPRAPRENFMSLFGNFISSDGMEGEIQIVSNAGIISFEAYWLEEIKDDLVLEQVVDINGNVLTRQELEEMTINRIYFCKNNKERQKLYSLGVPGHNIFDQRDDDIKKLQRIESNRELYIPEVSYPIPVKRAPKLKRHIN